MQVDIPPRSLPLMDQVWFIVWNVHSSLLTIVSFSPTNLGTLTSRWVKCTKEILSQRRFQKVNCVFLTSLHILNKLSHFLEQLFILRRGKSLFMSFVLLCILTQCHFSFNDPWACSAIFVLYNTRIHMNHSLRFNKPGQCSVAIFSGNNLVLFT